MISIVQLFLATRVKVRDFRHMLDCSFSNSFLSIGSICPTICCITVRLFQSTFHLCSLFLYRITSIVMSRFILSLRQVHLPDDSSDSETERAGHFTSGVFSARVSSRLMGNIAAPVSIGESNHQEASGGSSEVWDDPLMAGLQDSDQMETSGLELNIVKHPTSHSPVPGLSTIAEE